MPVRCLVIGVGKMGLAHLQALGALAPEALAGWAPSHRRRESVQAVGAAFLAGTLEEALRSFCPTHVVVASPVESLAATAFAVMAAGVRNVLIEKPAALSVVEGERLAAAANACGARVYVGYNRRFYGSVRTALARIRERGECVTSVLFEFNEAITDAAGPRGHAPEVAARWLLANSLHVIDTAFVPVGRPDPHKSVFFTAGSLAWHPSGSVFTGSGETDRQVAFAYHANWCGPGCWSVEWVTPSERYIFRPLEKLAIMRRGSFAVESVPLDDDFDERFKPGVYLQDQAFLEGRKNSRLPAIGDVLWLIALADTMGGYANVVGLTD